MRDAVPPCVVAVALLAAGIAFDAVAQRIATDASPPPRSVVLDKAQAEAIERARAPEVVDRIEVVGRDPDARRAPRKSVEQRFADALNAPRAAAFTDDLTKLDTRPCGTLASTFTSIGTAYNPYKFCP